MGEAAAMLPKMKAAYTRWRETKGASVDAWLEGRAPAGDPPTVDWPAKLTGQKAEVEDVDLGRGNIWVRIRLIPEDKSGVLRLEGEAEATRLAMLTVILAAFGQKGYIEVYAPIDKDGKLDSDAAKDGRVGSISMNETIPGSADDCVVTDVRAYGAQFAPSASKLTVRLADVKNDVPCALSAEGLARFGLAVACYVSQSPQDIRPLLLQP